MGRRGKVKREGVTISCKSIERYPKELKVKVGRRGRRGGGRFSTSPPPPPPQPPTHTPPHTPSKNEPQGTTLSNGAESSYHTPLPALNLFARFWCVPAMA